MIERTTKINYNQKLSDNFNARGYKVDEVWPVPIN